MTKLTAAQAWKKSHSALGHHLRTPDSKMSDEERQERFRKEQEKLDDIRRRLEL